MTTNADQIIQSIKAELVEIKEDIAFFHDYSDDPRYAELEGQARIRKIELEQYIAALSKLDHSPTVRTSSPAIELPVAARN